MSSPITPVLPGSSSYGLAWKQVTVMSVDGNIAKVRDQLSATFDMDRTKLRAKGDPPEVGETWIVDRSYGNEWTFALIIGKPIPTPPIPRPPQVYVVADATARDAIQSPDDGMVVYRLDRNYHEQYSATSNVWFALPRPGLIRRLEPTTNLNIPAGAETVDPDTMITFTPSSIRRYKLSYESRFSQTNAGTMTVTFRYVAGNGPILTTSTSFLTYTVPGNGGNFAGFSTFKVLPSLSGTYTVGVSLFSGSGAGASILYGAADSSGRSSILEDVNVSAQ